MPMFTDGAFTPSHSSDGIAGSCFGHRAGRGWNGLCSLSLAECNVVIGRVQRRKADFNTTKPVSVLENGVGCMGLVVVSQGDRI